MAERPRSVARAASTDPLHEAGPGFATTRPVAGADDRTVWVRVLVLAVLGFGVGVAWPKLTGVRFGPNAPGEVAAASARAPEQAAEAPAAKVETAPTGSVEAPLPTIASSVKLADSFVLSCTSKDGEQKKGPDCGPYRELDKLAEPKLRKLAACPAARTAQGHVSLVTSIDFAQRRLDASLGKSTSIQGAQAEGILACLKTDLEGLDVASLPHEQAKYTLVYKIDLEAGAPEPAAGASAAPAEPAPAAAAPAAGGTTAEVTWEVAIVRSAPRTGDVVARLPRGSKLKLQSSDNGWWKVGYGDGFGSEGYVYRGAIGR